MRYREENAAPDPDFPYSQSMHSMLTVSALLALLIGILLLYLGRKGKIMWLSWWSFGLILCSIGYLVLEIVGTS
ncbi:MAG: hypothetical protein KTR32_43135 [Granulosicoccus sp.]|nr:hypothetical protein [Granulosicoccus sp.]